MGCFLACFGSSKNKRYPKPSLVPASSSAPSPQNLAPKQAELDESIIVVPQSPVKQEEQLNVQVPKKVSFVSDSVEKAAEISPATKQSGNDSAISSLGSYPPSHRYHNCRESDNEDEIECEEEIDVCDYDEDKDAAESADDVYDPYEMEEDSPNTNQKQTPGSFSSMESRTKTSMRNLDDMLDDATPAAQTKMPDLNSNEQEQAVDASLSGWLVSSQKTPAKKSTPHGLEAIPSEKTQTSPSSHGSNSVRNFSDRPILGVLTIEQLKQIEASESPRKSPSHSLDDRPIIGSVGSHWSEETPSVPSFESSTFKGIPNTTSKYREDKTVKWHSTPFETRLEQALKKGASGVPF